MDVQKKILIVEDEMSLLTLLTDKFEREGFSTFQALDGEEGFTLALKEHPDLILLDLILPKMNGVTMLEKLREDQWGKDARVIVLSNLSDSEKIAECMKHGIAEYLVKSDWKMNDIIRKVKERLE